MSLAVDTVVMCIRDPKIVLAGALTTAVLALGGCQWMAPQSRTASTRPVDATADAESGGAGAEAPDLEARERELVQRTIELENEREANRLLRAELDATLIDLKYLESQFITLERQLTQEESRAGAVSALADAELLYDRIRNAAPPVLQEAEIVDVERRMAAADEAMTHHNYTAAAYYANRAVRLLNRSERRRQSFLSTGTARVVLVSSANLREGPGLEFDVVGQLTEGTVVAELDRRADWRRIRLRDGNEAWIYGPLVR